MTFWLCVTNEENWDVIREKNIWGVPERHRNTIAMVKPGDKCLIYVMSSRKEKQTIPPRVVAAYQVASEMFKDNKKIFSSPSRRNEVYPLRVKLEPLKIFEKPVDFRQLIPDLRFIRNKRKWAGHIQGRAMREIPEEDFQLIVERAE